ncbi:MAG: tetratricopeptide repeat protein [Anaerolineae bacterium]|nr:tetratricopeptide repeat protein [Anaerolineae bacterium]
MSAARAIGLFLSALFLVSCTSYSGPAVPSPALTAAPDPCPVLLQAAAQHAAVGERSEQEAALQDAAAACPGDPAPFLHLAALYLEWNRLEEGMAAVDRAERLGAAPLAVQVLRTAFYAALGDWRQVVACGELALEMDPANVSVWHQVALAYVVQERVGDARGAYGALLQLAPGDGLARARLGVLLALYDPAAALAYVQDVDSPLAVDLTSLLAADHDDPDYLLARIGQVCLAHDEPALAGVVLRRVVNHHPTYADAQALLGQALGQLGRTGEALEHLELAVDLAPDSGLARSLLGLYWLQEGDFSRARLHLEAAYDLDPENPALALAIAEVYVGLGRYDVAAIWIDEATRQAPSDPAVWEQAARFYLDRRTGEGMRDVGAAQTLVALAPESATAHDLLGWACFLTGQPAAAEVYLCQAVELDPHLALAHYHLGQLYAYLGRGAEAREALSLALDCNTDPALRLEIETALSAAP